MKISRLYLKILLAFIVVQVLAVILIGALVHIGKIRPPFSRRAEERLAVVKQLIYRDLEGASAITPELRIKLDSTLTTFSGAFFGEAWITDEQGTLIAASFDGHTLFTGEEEMEHKQMTPDGDMIYVLEREELWEDGNDRDRKAIYAVGAVPFADKRFSIHLLKTWHRRGEEMWLMRGLMLMGAISALLLIPVSQKITRPINELTESAENIGRGDFTPRVMTNRKDEVGQLARTFNDMALSLEKMIRGGRELIANLSHEFRSPLARIRMSQQIIQERLESGRTDGIEKHLHKVEAEINHMDGLIDKILQLSKLDLHEPQPREDMVPLDDLLRELVDLHQPLIASKNIEIALHIPALPEFQCRKEELRMVFDNVLINAVKYSPDGAILNVAANRDGNLVAIRVSNPYRSLSDEELESVFIPFKRLGYDAVEGNGLGLAFARKIVKEHGGTMTATSESGAFVMTILLPLD